MKDKIYPFVLFVILGGLIVGGINLYRETFIDWKMVLLVVVVVSAILSPIGMYYFKKQGEKLFGAVIMSILYLCPFVYFSFLQINYSFSDSNSKRKEFFAIVRNGEMVSKRSKRPYVIINFKNYEKQIVLNNYEKNLMGNSNTIEVEYAKGFFNYYVITNHNLIQKNTTD